MKSFTVIGPIDSHMIKTYPGRSLRWTVLIHLGHHLSNSGGEERGGGGEGREGGKEGCGRVWSKGKRERERWKPAGKEIRAD